MAVFAERIEAGDFDRVMLYPTGHQRDEMYCMAGGDLIRTRP